MEQIYEIPENVEELFKEVTENDGFMFYRMIDYTENLDMDNNQSMMHFLNLVDVPEDLVKEDDGTQVVLTHPSFKDDIVIDAGGLGDFYSHSFECYTLKK